MVFTIFKYLLFLFLLFLGIKMAVFGVLSLLRHKPETFVISLYRQLYWRITVDFHNEQKGIDIHFLGQKKHG